MLKLWSPSKRKSLIFGGIKMISTDLSGQRFGKLIVLERDYETQRVKKSKDFLEIFALFNPHSHCFFIPEHS